MIEVEKLFSVLKSNNVNFYTGVPDSVLKNMKYYLEELPKTKHIIAHNEGGAISLAIGYYLSTQNLAAVYMQNSGLTNALNPILSLCDNNVYSIPILLIIGWRGAPNIYDEQQHISTGKITIKLLKLLNISYLIIEKNRDFKKINKLINYSKKNNTPVAILFKKDTLVKKKTIYCKDKNNDHKYPLRYNVIELIINNLKKKDFLISTTGFTSRELNDLRIKNKSKKEKIKGKDFYVVGGMGHASSIALGSSIFKNQTRNQVVCLDGDGSIIMHMGSLATIGFYANHNFKHIVFNNYQHESVGGQKTVSKNLNFKNIVLGCGYKRYFFSDSIYGLNEKIKNFLKIKGPAFFEIIVKSGSIKNLGRPNNFSFLKKQLFNL